MSGPGAVTGAPPTFPAVHVPVSRVKVRSLWSDALRRLVANRLSMVGLGIVIFIWSVALFGPFFTPYDYLAQDLANVSKPPSPEHWLGTDYVGRDYLSRLMYAMRTAVMASIIVPVISMVIGVVVGTVSAYVGGWVDDVIMRGVEVVQNIPLVLFAALINVAIKDPVAARFEILREQTGWAIFGNKVVLDYLIVFTALALIQWTGEARLIRGQILSLREQDYVLAARSVGARAQEIMRWHLIPNGMGPLIVSFTFSMSGAMGLESALSFLGIGVQPPGASLGAMINQALTSWRDSPHLIAVPAVVIGILTLGLNFVGDGLNDALNPRQAQRVK